jgi:hypothetical protein
MTLCVFLRYRGVCHASPQAGLVGGVASHEKIRSGVTWGEQTPVCQRQRKLQTSSVVGGNTIPPTCHVNCRCLEPSASEIQLCIKSWKKDVMNMVIYIGLARRSVIPYIQYESVLLLLIFGGLSMDLVTVKIQTRVLAFRLVPVVPSCGSGCLL